MQLLDAFTVWVFSNQTPLRDESNAFIVTGPCDALQWRPGPRALSWVHRCTLCLSLLFLPTGTACRPPLPFRACSVECCLLVRWHVRGEAQAEPPFTSNGHGLSRTEGLVFSVFCAEFTLRALPSVRPITLFLWSRTRLDFWLAGPHLAFS